MKIKPPAAIDASCKCMSCGAIYVDLRRARDHLRLLAQLTEPQDERGPDVIYLSAEALAHCFDRLADDLDRIAQLAASSAP